MESASDFSPLEKATTLKQVALPKPSYWKSAWQKLQANPRALGSLYIIIVLLLFSVLGPIFWRVDPAHQDLSQISRPPSLGKEVVIFEVKPWDVSSQIIESLNGDEKLSGLSLIDYANTESVKLVWKPDSQADYYKVYRHDFKPLGKQDFGFPLGETLSALETYFEDKLKLEAKSYFYSVLAIKNTKGFGEKLIASQTIKVNVTQVISKKQAEKNIAKGLWKSQDEFEFSKTITLPAHPMGTDYLGRDMMARLMWGGRTSLLIGIFASFLFVFIGSLYGAMSAYVGGQTDNVLMRFADFVIALPFLLFMILLKVSFGLGAGESGITVMVFSLIILSWPSSARLVRAQVLVLKEQSFVLAARLNGGSTFYIVRRHLLPNVMSVIFVSLSFAIPSVILTEAFLSFIGLGVVPPTPSWGSMCQEGIKTFLYYPHELIFPALFIGVTVLAFNLLGDGLRDALDVKSVEG